MKVYQKINTIYKRDPENLKRLIIGDYAEEAFEYLASNEWIFTEKVNGTNIRVMVKRRLLIPPEPGFEFRGKEDDSQMPTTLIKKLQDIFYPQTDKIHEMFPCDTETAIETGCAATLYGEGYGAKIQKGGGNYRPDQDFVLFDVNVGGWWLKRDAIEDVANKLGLEVVPIIGKGTLHDMVNIVQTGFKSKWGDFMAEGIVAKPSVELRTRAGDRIITKLKHKDFQR